VVALGIDLTPLIPMPRATTLEIRHQFRTPDR
jgi:hypothetical protein